MPDTLGMQYPDIRNVCRSRLSIGLAASLFCVSGVAAQVPATDNFPSCVAGLRQASLAAGVAGETFDAIAPSLTPNDVLHFQTEQPEFHTAVWDYMAGLVDDERVSDGKAKYREWGTALKSIQSRFGVDASILVAVWGVESDYGKTFGLRPIVQSLATLSCYGRRPDYFKSEFVAALKILQAGDAAPDRFNGSWAGAFGHTQFMPSTFLRNAVDIDGNGHPNIVDSVPDALGTTANYLRKSGWVPGVVWGYEVKLPPGYSGPSGRKNRHPPAFWSAKGIMKADGGPLTGADVGLLLPAGPQGPAFLVTRNFDAIYAYNAAEVYALAIASLSDRIEGAGSFVTPWPVDDPGLSRIDRREVQTRLQAKGYAIGNTDGVMGVKTLEAIADYEGRVGLPANGRASQKLLQALRDGR
ncbi:lytic murein transglycosylase [Lichenihabitans psoromatis]|uniref:lytic murein transglycosylase n=1 Tax=Lichenihabitans psoromatis TaxID=2528642 RepID=UPI001FE006CD|nr:lytic murein transglycosylase [Lichenihabitans psoromatis]